MPGSFERASLRLLVVFCKAFVSTATALNGDCCTRLRFADASYSYGSFNTHRSNLRFGQTTRGGFLYEIDAFQNYSDNALPVVVAGRGVDVVRDVAVVIGRHEQVEPFGEKVALGILQRRGERMALANNPIRTANRATRTGTPR